MDKQHWLDQLRGELAQQKLPLDYVERFTSELSDHFTDLMENDMSTDAQHLSRATGALGFPREIARAAGSEHRKTHFAARRPILTFIVMPMLALPILWTASVLAVMAVGQGVVAVSGQSSTSGKLPEAVMSALPLAFMAILAMSVLLCAIAFCRLASRAAVGWKWTLAACCVLALVGSMAIFEVGVPTGPDHGQQGSLRFVLAASRHPKPAQVLQFAVPLAVCGLALVRGGALRPRELAQ